MDENNRTYQVSHTQQSTVRICIDTCFNLPASPFLQCQARSNTPPSFSQSQLLHPAKHHQIGIGLGSGHCRVHPAVIFYFSDYYSYVSEFLIIFNVLCPPGAV
jgi:hypothetical protein